MNCRARNRLALALGMIVTASLVTTMVKTPIQTNNKRKTQKDDDGDGVAAGVLPHKGKHEENLKEGPGFMMSVVGLCTVRMEIDVPSTPSDTIVVLGTTSILRHSIK